jgi:hypothetical protein
MIVFGDYSKGIVSGHRITPGGCLERIDFAGHTGRAASPGRKKDTDYVETRAVKYQQQLAYSLLT